MATLRSLLCLLLIAVHGHCSSETLVPFIAWSNGGDLSAVSSKQPSTIKEFLTSTELRDVQYFVVFKTSKLSFDDIAKFGGVYGEKHSALTSLQSSLQSAGSTLWTGMHGRPATLLVNSLSFSYDVSEQHVSGVEDVSLDENGKQLFVVILPEGDSEERVFLEQDKLISQVMATLSQSKKRYIAFYTADHSSSQQSPQLQVFKSRREAADGFYDSYLDESSNLTSTGTVCALMNNGSSTANGGRCVMMCLKTPIYLIDFDAKSSRLHAINDTAETIRFMDGSCLRGNETGQCNDEVAPYLVAEATFNNTRTVLFKFTFRQGTNINCTVPKGYWTIGLEVDGESYARNTMGKIFSKFEVPVGASYACGNNSHNIYHVPYGNDTEKNANITTAYMFTGLQAQVGGVFTTNSFASVYNCESYFSHVTLMGIFSIAILLIVLYCSVVFMFQMKTMDRFDDPRGPTISVENLH